jgi:hypothetical protein
MPSEASLANLRAPWKPGQSGNKGARPTGYKRVLAAARQASPEAMEKAIECMRDPLAPWAQRLKAIEIILDRAWGAPDQRLQLDAADGINTLRIEFVAPGAVQEAANVINGKAEHVTFELPFPDPDPQ